MEMDLFWRRGIKGFFDYLKILGKIRRKKFDIGIDMRRSKMNIMLLLFVPRIKTRISYYNINGGKAFLTHPILCDKKMNNVLENAEMVNRSLGTKITNLLPHIATDAEDEKIVKELMQKNGLKNYIVIVPRATTTSKEWPEKKFEQFIERFHKEYPGYKIVVSGGGSDEEVIRRLCKGREFCMELINFNLRRISILFKKAEAIIANDGGAGEIAWVSGGNFVLLGGGVDLELYHPLNNNKIIHHKLPCYPCDWGKECKKPTGKWCMDLITVDEVMKAVKDFIRKK